MPSSPYAPSPAPRRTLFEVSRHADRAPAEAWRPLSTALGLRYESFGGWAMCPDLKSLAGARRVAECAFRSASFTALGEPPKLSASEDCPSSRAGSTPAAGLGRRTVANRTSSREAGSLLRRGDVDAASAVSSAPGKRANALRLSGYRFCSTPASRLRDPLRRVTAIADQGQEQNLKLGPALARGERIGDSFS